MTKLSIWDILLLNGDISVWDWVVYSIVAPIAIVCAIFIIFTIILAWPPDIKGWLKSKFKRGKHND